MKSPIPIVGYSSYWATRSIGITFVLLLFSFISHAQTYSVWSGSVNNDWNNASNWELGGVPIATTQVVISPSANPPIISTNTALAHHIQIENGAALTISNTGTLTINATDARAFHNNGTFINNGNLLISSTREGLFNNGNMTNSLNATITVTCNSTAFYHLSGLLINAGTISIDNDGAGNIAAMLCSDAFTNTATGHIRLNNTSSIGFYINSDNILNEGLLEIGTASITRSTKGIYAVKGTLNNLGSITVANSTSAYVQGQLDARLINKGVFTAGISGGDVEFISSQEYPFAGFINDAGGILKGNGKIHAMTFMDRGGTISPGNSPGIISFIGAQQLENSILALEVNGKTTAGTDFDQINLNNRVMLGGTLQLTMNYPSPTDGDEVLLLQATEIVDTFSAVTGLPLGWELKYDYPSTGKVSLKYSSALPVQLAYFDVARVENQVELKWQTTHQENTEFFEIERSTDGNIWQKIATVNGLGFSDNTKNYSYIDSTPLTGIHYYRLRIVDTDGQFEYSKMRSIKSDLYFLSAYPNPTNGVIQLKGETGNVKVYDIGGQKVLETIVSNQQLDLSRLPSGVYLICPVNNGIIRVVKQ